MPVVIADTGPLNYLVLINRAAILADLFGAIVVPEAVRRELTQPGAPEAVRAWMEDAPDWLSIRSAPREADPALRRLGDGEREAVELAVSLRADLVVMDDRAGVAAARGRGLAVVGTLGLIDRAAERGLLDARETVERLRRTSFRARPELLDTILAKHSGGS